MQKPTGAAGLGTLGSTTKKERETAKEKFSSIPSTFSHLDLQVRYSELKVVLSLLNTE